MAGPQLCYDDIVPMATTSAHQPASSPHIADVLFLEFSRWVFQMEMGNEVADSDPISRCSPGPAFGPLGVIVVIAQVLSLVYMSTFASSNDLIQSRVSRRRFDPSCAGPSLTH